MKKIILIVISLILFNNCKQKFTSSKEIFYSVNVGDWDNQTNIFFCNTMKINNFKSCENSIVKDELATKINSSFMQRVSESRKGVINFLKTATLGLKSDGFIFIEDYTSWSKPRFTLIINDVIYSIRLDSNNEYAIKEEKEGNLDNYALTQKNTTTNNNGKKYINKLENAISCLSVRTNIQNTLSKLSYDVMEVYISSEKKHGD